MDGEATEYKRYLSAAIYITPILLIAFLLFPIAIWATDIESADTRCNSPMPKNISVFVFPQYPVSDAPVRVVAIAADSQTKLSVELLTDENNDVAPERSDSWGYRPRAASIWFPGLPAQTYRVLVTDSESQLSLGCVEFAVKPATETDRNNNMPIASQGQYWPVTNEWSVAMEDLYSVFVAKLFYVPPGASKGWRPLGRATQDPYRNILYGILGYNEDNESAEVPVVLSPDCADAPMQVRAYFSWKMGLPMRLNECVRGTSLTGPWCYDSHDNLSGNPKDVTHPVARFNWFIETKVNWKTHAGIYRTLPDDSESAVYPIALTRESIRPGTIFVDAGGHIILVTQSEPQGEKTVGALYGIDGHPDFTVTHKAFSKGTFVFNHQVPTDGFKAFRPVVQGKKGLRFVTNGELSQWPGLPVYSNEQTAIERTEDFYIAVQKALNPNPIDPVTMLQTKIEVLHHAVMERVEAVQLGVDYMAETYWKTMEIPDGPAIFQTIGPWEIYSTPARDMRLLLVIDDVLQFPKQVDKNPDLYVSERAHDDAQDHNEAGSVREMLNHMLSDTLAKKSITYIRSDKTPWTLSLADIIARRAEFEMGYNPNDCPEVRWGAPSHSDERSTCTHRTPLGQLRKMQKYRKWFIDRRRPDQR